MGEAIYLWLCFSLFILIFFSKDKSYMETLTAQNPAGETIYFDPVLHKYYNDDGEVLTSNTKFVSSFFPQFETKRISEIYAKKRNLDPEKVRTMWKEKGLQSSHLGTEVHEFAQSLFEKTNYEFEDKDITNRRYGLCQAAIAAHDLLIKKYQFIQAEKIVFSMKLSIAGTIDLLMRDEKNRRIIIIDWKTNLDIKKTNFWQNALSPICHLEDCSANKYYLQLNLYKYILKKENYFPGYEYKMALAHLEQMKINWIVVDDLETEIQDMLNWI